MSQENLELAERFNEAFNRGDVEAALEFLADDFVLTWTEAPFGVPRTAHGREGFADSWSEWAQLFDDFAREVEEWTDAGDWVISVGSWVGTGKGSGARVGNRNATATRVHEGKLVEMIMGLGDKEAALEAAGLSE